MATSGPLTVEFCLGVDSIRMACANRICEKAITMPIVSSACLLRRDKTTCMTSNLSDWILKGYAELCCGSSEGRLRQLYIRARSLVAAEKLEFRVVLAPLSGA